jgi:hypothetical protein
VHDGIVRGGCPIGRDLCAAVVGVELISSTEPDTTSVPFTTTSIESSSEAMTSFRFLHLEELRTGIVTAACESQLFSSGALIFPT